MKLHYYCYDYNPSDGDDALYEYATKDEFIEWALDNRRWAEEGGDEVPSEKDVLKLFDTEHEADIDLNGFNFLQSRLDKEEASKVYYE